MDEKGFKKLLIDLELSLTDVGDATGIHRWAVTRYFRGDLRSTETRDRIKQVLEKRADEKGIELPPFWESEAA